MAVGAMPMKQSVRIRAKEIQIQVVVVIPDFATEYRTDDKYMGGGYLNSPDSFSIELQRDPVFPGFGETSLLTE